MSTFNKRKFIALAEAYLEKERLKWIASVRADKTTAEYARQYAMRENWILPVETLDDISALNLFPNADVIARANAVDLGAYDITELEAKMAISAAVKAGIAEAESGIEAIRALCTTVKAPQEPILAPLAPGTKERGTDAAPALPGATVEAVRGVPDSIASTNIRLHVFHVEQMEFYTTDRAIIEYVQAAQVQDVDVNVTWVAGEHGNRALSVKLA